MNQFRFANPEYFYILIAVPILIVLFIFILHAKKKAIKSFGDIELLSQLMPEISYKRPLYKFLLLLSAFIMIVLAIARPQFGSKLKETKQKGKEIVIAIDVSNSMIAEDLKPNRLENAKQAISKLVDNLGDDNVGLIVFAGDAYTLVPITSDFGAIKMFLPTIKPGIVSNQGTAIGAAIDLGMRSFTTSTEKNKALILITDGENHEDDALTAAKEAKSKGIIVHTIGLGSAQGAPIPIEGTSDFKRDKDGGVIVTRLNEQMLSQIATAGGGTYVHPSSTFLGLNDILDEINKMEKQEVMAKNFSEYEDKFQYFLLIAIFLILLDVIVLERKNKVFQKINIFK